jgi:tetratricopeptide (TPR) repeat protein
LVFGVQCSVFDVRVPVALAVLVLMLCAGSAPAFTPALSLEFDSANRLYEQGKFRDAISAYQKIIQTGRVSPALYFNLGNAFFKSGEVGRAVAAYRQAERMDPRDPDLRANLQFVRSQIPGPTLSPGRWERWLGRLTLNEWAVLAAIALWSWLLLLALGQLWPAWRQSLRTFQLIGGIGTVALGGCLGATLLAGSAQTAIVITDDAAVRNGPLDEAPAAFTVHDGAELTVLDHKNDWWQVSAGDRRIGWLKRDQVVVWP